MRKSISSLFALVGMTGILVFFQSCDSGFRPASKKTISSSLASSQSGALAVLKANCASCHNASGLASVAPFAEYKTDLEFINAGLVVAGDVDSSKIILRLRNYTGSGINKNMPPAAAISSADYATLVNWVSQMSGQINPFQCDSNTTIAQKVQPTEVKRLSQRQYLRTLRDLISRGLPTTTAQAIVATASNNLILPIDDNSEFARSDTSLSQQHIRAYFDLSDRIATALVTDPNYTPFVTALINLNPGSCTSINVSSLSAACVSQFINNFGYRALRRPLINASGANEPSLYLAAYDAAGGGRPGISAVIFRFMMAPHFLFTIEDHEITTATSRLYRLSSYSIASKLSYLFWNSMPDESLLNRAASTDLSVDANFIAALDYVANSPNTSDSVREYMSEWLRLSRVPQFSSNNSALSYLANGINLDSGLRTEMINEVEELGSYVYSQNLPFSDLFSSNVSFARDSRLVSIYGLSQAAPQTVTPQNAVRFPASERSGILTRAALLSFGSELANPIKRGIRIRREILCLPLDNPPKELTDALTPPPINIHSTTRERYDAKTSPDTCFRCHQYINSLGHSLGSYNAFGRYQTQEPTFDDNGNYSGNNLTINTAVDLSTSISPGISAQNALELSSIVASQRSTQSCFSEKYFKFAIGRPANKTAEGCRLNSIYGRLRNSRSLKEVMRAVAEDQEFRHRRMGQ